jgi:hypothetical protein
MTQFAKPLVVQCPLCSGYLLKTRLASYNNFGAKYWTDGYVTFGLDMYYSALVKCEHCHKQFWNEDAKELGRFPDKPKPIGRFTAFFEKITGDKHGVLSSIEYWNSIPIEIRNAPYMSRAETSGWLDVYMNRAELSIEREIIVRRRVWWISQNHLRHEFDGQPRCSNGEVPEDEAHKNMQGLLHLHEQGEIKFPAEKAELLRQLSRFYECLDVIQQMEIKLRNSPLVMCVQKLAQSENSMVQEIPEKYQS